MSFYSFLQSLQVVVFGHQGQEGIVAHQLLVLHIQEEVHVLLVVVVASLKAVSLVGSRRRVLAAAAAGA